MDIKYAAEKENSFNFSQKYFDSKVFNFFAPQIIEKMEMLLKTENKIELTYYGYSKKFGSKFEKIIINELEKVKINDLDLYSTARAMQFLKLWHYAADILNLKVRHGELIKVEGEDKIIYLAKLGI